MDRLRGVTAMITGGTGGIGAETARLFHTEGAQVAIVDLDPAQAAWTWAATIADDDSGAAVLPVTADISREDEAARAVAETVAAFGGLTVLVNNAGVREYGPLADASSESWDRIIGVNLLGTANCAKAALPELRKADAASHRQTSRPVHAEVGREGMGQYDATKAAIVSMDAHLGVGKRAKHAIRVNAVCPGGTLTPFHIAPLWRARGQRRDATHQASRGLLAGPMGRSARDRLSDSCGSRPTRALVRDRRRAYGRRRQGGDVGDGSSLRPERPGIPWRRLPAAHRAGRGTPS